MEKRPLGPPLPVVRKQTEEATLLQRVAVSSGKARRADREPRGTVD